MYGYGEKQTIVKVILRRKGDFVSENHLFLFVFAIKNQHITISLKGDFGDKKSP